MSLENQNSNVESRWPHRLAVVLVCATFPLIFIGGTVTTYKAGMAVADYPTTFGYNMFLYPWTTWIAGPWNIFVEHGHRMFAALVGLVTIGLVVVAWRMESRVWVRQLTYLALALVCFQGGLGGARVLLNAVTLARWHACIAPLFFALAVAIAAVMSRRWRSTINPIVSAKSGSLQRLSVLTTVLAYCQIVAGAFVRHIPEGATADYFRIAVFFHLALAAALAIHIPLVLWNAVRHHRAQPAVFRPAVGLACLLVLQLALGAATYVMKYNWPPFMADFGFSSGMVVERNEFWSSLVTTAHVAVGSLILVTSLAMAIWSFRLYRPETLPGPGDSVANGSRWMGVAV